MGPVTLYTIVVHNIALNRPDNFPSYPPDNHHCSDDRVNESGSPIFRGSEAATIKLHTKEKQVSAVADKPRDAVRHAHGVLNQDGRSCDEPATVVGRNKLTTLETIVLPWRNKLID